MSKQWFHSWFNSPYYHLLYQQRNTAEAGKFIDLLIPELQLPPGARILDAGCGRGRHARRLQHNGYRVTGIDLSVANIAYALRYRAGGLQFFAHDMRRLYYREHFSTAINLFTSFGYFETEEEHIRILQHINSALLTGGLLVLDYLNSEKVMRHLQPEAARTVNGVAFSLSKRIEGRQVLKEIRIDDHGHHEQFEERVLLFTRADFERMFARSGFTPVKTFGSYQLAPFDSLQSDRLILICKKTP